MFYGFLYAIYPVSSIPMTSASEKTVINDSDYTLECFAKTGYSHLYCAESLLTTIQNTRKLPPQKMISSVCYLAHIALECAMKALLCYRASCAGVADLRKKDPKVYEKLFRGKTGHNLKELSECLSIQNIMRRYGMTWRDDPIWKRMGGSERPYSLRYGVESPSPDEAEQELDRTDEIQKVLLKNLPKDMRGR